MAKGAPSFICQECGAVYARWMGRCEACNAWNSIMEEASPLVSAAPIASGGVRLKKGRVFPLEGLSGDAMDAPRLPANIAELDRVTGGGFVKGSVILIGGEPGIGKSTLLMQAAAAIARQNARVVYISGEESKAQVRLRAQRLKLADAPVDLAAETSLEDILATLAQGAPPRLVIIDSIQTMWTQAVEAAPGTVTQVRASAQGLIRYAKASGAAIILVGHVTKDGQIAGPRVVEHMVDAVMSFEGDSGHHFRILRAVKNRFGATDEIGVFEMGSFGLVEVPNPSALFLGARDTAVSGTAVFAGMEGTRPLLVEIQALVTPTSLGTPRRAVVGWEPSRLAMVLAVLEARGGVRLGQHDVYMNVAGGFRILEPAADLAVAGALISSLADIPIPPQAILFGEISLSGLIRPVPQAAPRLKEAAKLGFTTAIVAEGAAEAAEQAGLKVRPVQRIADLVAEIAGGNARSKSTQQR
jgi:DNA repair protein RadA/Sms